MPQRSPLARPQSAPTLLRGEGLIAQRPYEDSLRQEIEDATVRDVRETLQRQKHVTMDKFNALKGLGHPYLYDLKLWHGSGQRAKATAQERHQLLRVAASGHRACGIAVCHRGSLEGKRCAVSPCIGSVRDLCSQLRTDLSHHCERLGLPEQDFPHHQ